MSFPENAAASTSSVPPPLFSGAARRRLELFAVLCGPLFTLCAAIGWLALSQGLIPFDPSSSAEELAADYADKDFRIILGSTIFLIGCGLLVFWLAQLSVMMAAIEGPRPVLAAAQLVGGIGVVTFVSSACCLWVGAAFRADTDPDVVVALNDAGWLTFMLTWPGLSVQLIAAGLVIWFARGRTDALGPGWVGLYCFASAAIIALVGAVAFTKTGPFAWNGALGYYLPFTVWAISFELISWSMFRTLRAEPTPAQPPTTAGVPDNAVEAVTAR